ncbi:unnamed protein product [Cuscuta europaea]|uniref:Uncharacterized protein n=1 Tax=Cuscuta europaea TaxID=41803 RepID=A0A9P1DZ60_CUSEU|nr:unnamed protein product [Cuscuta europaea]
MASKSVYSMEEFLEVISLKEQLYFHELRRKQRQSSGSQVGGTHRAHNLSEALEELHIKERLSALENKMRDRESPSVLELFGELCYTQPPPPSPSSNDPSSSSGPVPLAGSEEASTIAADGEEEPSDEIQANGAGHHGNGRNEGRV